jgi:mono/diheme cytochrome c family protein/DNA-binding beta-propeller fold protein YncE
MRRAGTVILLGITTLATTSACGGGASQAHQPATASGASGRSAVGSCARARTGALPLAPASANASSSVALARLGDTTLAYVADEDTRALRTIDVDSGREIGVTHLEGRPSHVIVLQDGRVAVGLRDEARVQILEPSDAPAAPMQARCAVDVAAEPVAFALTPDKATLLVSSGWGRTLGAYDAGTLVERYRVALAREPRAVVVSDDGRTAFVAHAVGGQVSRVDLGSTAHAAQTVALHGASPADLQAQLQDGAMTAERMVALQKRMQHAFLEAPASCQGFALAKTEAPAGRVLAPQVLVDPGDTNTAPSGYGNDNQDTEEPDVAVIDEATGTPFQASTERTTTNRWGGFRLNSDGRDAHQEECLLPRAAAYDGATHSLLVTCLGTDAVVAYDALAASPARAEKRRWNVAAGPTGVAVDPGKHRAVVWSQFDRVVSVIPLDGPDVRDEKLDKAPAVVRVALAADPERPVPVDVALGRLLFHSVGDARISRDGRACASCHPDGRDDSLVWATPDGPRRSIMLAGRLKDTAPYAWNGSEQALVDHLGITFDRLHGAGGLRSLELDALAAYVNALPQPVAPTQDDARTIARGAQVFASAEVGCAGCHSGATATDNQVHDVKSKTDQDRSGSFNTPTLRFVGGTGPYFHDGRYKTLTELLRGADGTMGHTKQLSDEDVAALAAYVGSR